MSKAIRITLIIVAVLCVPALIFPQLGASASPAGIAGLLIISGMAAILWPPAKVAGKQPIASEQRASLQAPVSGTAAPTESGHAHGYETEAEMSTTQSGFHRREESGFQRKDAA